MHKIRIPKFIKAESQMKTRQTIAVVLCSAPPGLKGQQNSESTGGGVYCEAARRSDGKCYNQLEIQLPADPGPNTAVAPIRGTNTGTTENSRRFRNRGLNILSYDISKQH
ncbi:hypothetical protein BV898_07433 [Hypsibius exemplaris]|uniref:Uncharacterized protein n=1 Tax=Hypsibius exemplaris TaxID=2072580 RepID=A0A1W0WTA1_HYPEX|nr:hypothetical protein BV898_07433 [Hypsibius exemplaris]